MVKGACALRIDDGLHAAERPAGVEDVACYGKTVAAAHIGVRFNQAAGQAQRFLAQVVGRTRIVFEHEHHVAGFEHRAHTLAYGLAAIGDDHFERQVHARGDVFKQPAQTLRIGHGAHLGGGANRDVQHQVGRASRDFFGQDGGHHLCGRVQRQRALDRNQHVVGG